MRFFTFLLCLLPVSVAACAPGSPPAATADSTAAVEIPCRQTSLDETPDDPVELVLTMLEVSRDNDRRCGTPDAPTRLCRALLAISSIDPAHFLDQTELRRRSAELMAWVSLDAAAASEDPDLRAAFELVGETALRIGDRAPDHELAELIMARASSAVVGPLERAWRTCPGAPAR